MNDVTISYVTVLLFVTGVVSGVPGISGQLFTPECTSWDGIKKQLEDADHISCNIINACAGLNCSGQFNGHDVEVKIVIEPCTVPPVLNATFDIPFLGIHNMHHIMKDGERYKFPRIIDALNIYVDVSMKKINQTIFLSVTVNPHITGGDASFQSIVLLHNATINVPQCHKESQLVSTRKPKQSMSLPKTNSWLNIATTIVPMASVKKCVEENVNDCGENEVCTEMTEGVSECKCKDDFVRNYNLICVSVLSSVGKKCNLTDLEHASCDTNEICITDGEESLGGSCYCIDGYHDGASGVCSPGPLQPDKNKTWVIIIACILPILALLLCGVVFFLAIKFRLVPRLRERFTNVRTYEVMSIGNDDDEPLVA